MADIELKRIHNLGLRAARSKAESLADHLGRKFDLKGDWDGNVLKFERPGVTGSLAITDKDVHLLVSLGFLLKAMKGSIEQAVRHELDTLFAEAPGATPSPGGNDSPKPKKGAAPKKKAG